MAYLILGASGGSLNWVFFGVVGEWVRKGKLVEELKKGAVW